MTTTTDIITTAPTRTDDEQRMLDLRRSLTDMHDGWKLAVAEESFYAEQRKPARRERDALTDLIAAAERLLAAGYEV